MHQSKLIKLLKSLDPTAFRRLRKVLESPCFTANKHLLQLYLYLKKYYPDFEHPHLDKEVVFFHLFPGRVYSDAKMRNLMSECLTLVEDMLVLDEMKKDDSLRQNILMDFYQSRNEAFYLNALNKLTKTINASTYRDPTYFSKSLHLALRHTEWSAERNQIEAAAFRQKEAAQLLDHYYTLLRAQFDLARKASRATKNDPKKKTPLPLFDTTALDDNLLYQLYQLLDEILEGGPVEKISEFLQVLKGGKEKIKKMTHRELFVALLNYCIGQMHIREMEFLPLVFDLYQFGLAEEILLENQQITATTFLNILIIGGRLGKARWTAGFLKDYAHYIPSEERRDVLALGAAYQYFYTQRFSDSLKVLMEHSFQNPLQLYPARNFRLRCFFELYLEDSNYSDSLDDQCAAFGKYIRRNKVLSEKLKESALNFMRMLLKIKSSIVGGKISAAKKEALRKELEAIERMESRKWLLEKLDQL